MQQLLWIETLLKLAGGLVLLLLPRVAIRVLGLPAGDNAFWPRLVGAVLVGLAAAFYIEGALPGSRGMGLAGGIAVNLAAAAVVAAYLLANRLSPSVRGRFILWLLVAALFALSLIEIAQV